LSYPATDQAAVYTFDIGNQLTSIANKVLPSTNIATYAYTDFDAVGNREEMQRTYLNGSAATTNYTYNDLYELSGTSGVQSHSYAYDKVGNRTTVDSVNYTDNTKNQYTAVGGVTYTNSTNGNITSDGTSTFGYDAENRLVSFDTTGTTNDATYAYDALGRRVKKTVNGTSTFFVYDGDDIIADYSSGGTLLREYIHSDNVDEILAMQAGANTYYYHYDGLGSVTEITDDTGAIVENYTYDPSGTPSVTTSTINNRYRFTGREYDEESGLYHYRARAYSPAIGRFMQRDPIGYYDGMNLYRYVGNNPVNYIDPLGLTQEELDAAFSWIKGHKPDLIIKETYNPKDKKLPGKLLGWALPSGQVYVDTEKIKRDFGGQGGIVGNLAHEIMHSNDGVIKTLFSSKEDHWKIYLKGFEVADQYLEWLKKNIEQEEQKECK
jgi:RHS repeat-associated protein